MGPGALGESPQLCDFLLPKPCERVAFVGDHHPSWGIRYVEGFLPTPGDFYKNRILIKIGFKPTFKPSKTVPDHVKLSFLSAALDPQEMVRRYWSYEGFMPIFRSS